MLGNVGNELGKLAEKASPQAVRVMLAMIATADTTGSWRGTAADLGRRLGVSRWTVGECLAELQAAGFAQLERTSRGQAVQLLLGDGARAQHQARDGARAQHQAPRDGARAQHHDAPNKEHAGASAGAGKYQSFSRSKPKAITTTTTCSQQPGGGGGVEFSEIQGKAVSQLVRVGVMQPAAERAVQSADVVLVLAVLERWRAEQSQKKPPGVGALVYRLRELAKPGSDIRQDAEQRARERAEKTARAAAAQQRVAAAQRPQPADTSGDDDAAELQQLPAHQVLTLCAALDADPSSRGGAPWTPSNYVKTPGRVMRAALVLRDLRAAGTLPAAPTPGSLTNVRESETA